LNDIFSHLHRRRGTTWFATPTNIVTRTIHPLTGRVVAVTREGAVKEKFIAGREPAAERAEDYDESGRVILGREFADWIASGDNWLAGRVSLAGASVASGVRLVSPLPGTTFFLDPDLPGDGSRVRLRADGAGKIRWRSESLECREENGQPIAILREGRHRLAASTESGGASAETWILVKRL
jgi:penicillin-binding protein 1C